MEIDNALFGAEIEWNTRAPDYVVIDCLREVGLETTICSRMDYSSDHWALKHDGSIGHGWEIVSPPSSLARLKSDLALFTRGIARMRERGHNSRAGVRCGVHIHVSNVGEGSLDSLRNITRRALAFEDTLDLLLPESRRGNNNTFCRSNIMGNGAWGWGDFDARCVTMFESLASAGSVSRIVDMVSPSRYFKYNVQSLSRHGTLEWRHHGASLNGEKIARWAEFIGRFCLVSAAQQRVWKRKPGPQGDRFYKMMRGMPGALVAYMSNRIQALNGSFPGDPA